MEIFIEIKRDLRRLGILEYNHSYSKSISFAQYSLIVVLLFTDFTTPLWFFFYNAQTFIEHVEAALPIFCGFLSLMAYCTYSSQGGKIIELITEYEMLIAQRKSNVVN